MRKQVKLLEYHADMTADFINIRAPVGNAFPVHKNFSASRRFQQIQAAQECGFPGTGRSDHAHDFAGVDLRVNALQDIQRSKTFFQASDNNFRITPVNLLLFMTIRHGLLL